MNYPLPMSAIEIVQGIEAGMRPSGPLLVSCHRGHAGHTWDNAIVDVDPLKTYRWDWVKGLPSVVVLMGEGTRFGTLLGDLLRAEPLQLDVVDTDRGLGWMVLFTKPKLRTLRWPAAQVADWLGDQQWHLDMKAERERFGLVAA